MVWHQIDDSPLSKPKITKDHSIFNEIQGDSMLKLSLIIFTYALWEISDVGWK